MAGGRAMSGWGEIWLVVGFAMHLAGAAAASIGAVWIWSRGDGDRPDRLAVIAALVLSAGWCVTVAAFGPLSLSTQSMEIARNCAWIAALYRLFAADGRHQTLRPIRPVIAALAFVELLQIVLLTVGARYGGDTQIAALVFQLSAMFRIMVAVGILMLVHNLYVGAAHTTRSALRWTGAALAAMWAFDLNFYTIGYLGKAMPAELSALRGLVMAAVVLPLVIGSARSNVAIRIRPSRTVAFQSLSLLLIAAYLLFMVGIAQSLSMLGSEFGRLTQVGFTVAASVVALLWLPSHRLRGWVRVTAVKHLFQHRYDYRAEWLRFTRTIGKSGEGKGAEAQSLQERVIQSLADITDSPSGVLFRPKDTGNDTGHDTGGDRGRDIGALELAARWSWPGLDIPANPIPAGLARLFVEETFILDIDDLRNGRDQHGEGALCPDWLRDTTKAWAMVPLLHFDRLVGVVLLGRPPASRRLDWEDFDLLRVVGQQLASYLAEQSGQQALMESARFDDFNRRIAFVMHDIKNLASQMSLLARNAERHAENPAFRADMLVTLRNSADKLNGLLARLNHYGPTDTRKRAAVDLAALAQGLCRRHASPGAVRIAQAQTCRVMADPEALEQALVHLVQNAVDASADGVPVTLAVLARDGSARIEIVDQGAGMSPEFVRDGLFKPFVSSKNSGFGIGAFEAREIIRSMGGRLDVETREGVGSRFIVGFPILQIDADKTHSQLKVA
ncbi:MAG: XrtA/PEP-CTERM system histidine kinase PrsK [Pontixanthobacter sp.]